MSSKENKLIKEYVKLREKKSARREQSLFVVEGARLCRDAAISGAEIKYALITDEAREKYSDYCLPVEKSAVKVYDITEQIASVLSDTKSAQGLFLVASMPKRDFNLENINWQGAYLAIEDIQDPGNLGTVLRTAEAMGISAVLLSKGCTDVFSPKVVRASMGAVFRLPILDELNIVNTIKTLKSVGIRVYAAVADGGEDILKLNLGKGTAAVIGNEGNGLTDDCINICSGKLNIRMRGRAESLNAATAASVIIWEMTKNL